jgi:homoserine dehydrogenase
MKLVLIGFGFVAKSFVRLLERKRAQLKADGIEYSIVGIATGRHGHAVNIDGLDVNEIMDLVEKGASISKTSRQPCENALDVIRHSNASVMFENSPLDVVAGEPAITHARTAFEFGMHVITANKGTVVHAYQSLCDLANSKHRRFLFEGLCMWAGVVVERMCAV